ncbi:MAG TPA: tetratricopeptide repeat protein [Ohtaekwangia sp.]|uniref:tetratricopeptide repeat protein n=1 Tax=Ohtaekwangia sp. TaxID=2066019 RepID=UPI002F9297CB
MNNPNYYRERITLLLVLISHFCNAQSDDYLQKSNEALANGRYTEAIGYLDKLLESNADNEQALLLRSQANYALKKYDLVIQDCEKILQINNTIITDDDFTAIWNLGVTYNSMRQFEKARSYFDKALKMQPENIRLYDNIGYSYVEEKNYTMALKQFQKMVSLNSRSDKGFYEIGKVYYLKKEYKKAIEAFNKAIELNPSYGIAYQNRGSAKLELKDMEGCCRDWKKSEALGITQIKPYIAKYCK